ncbi:hypothetical protein PVAP13_3KG267749 [Panicum virgatum]|uniref:SWIM-type domain-containing protein n=1 Tax=Panicum virgatum TaxID=38727 RepID=A0A8T0UUP3_PANVG|nr:hypothetical protein PVAP13_3KG267749 [Panicum virgatum]
MCVAGGAGAHVSSSNLTLPVISNETLHLSSNSAPPELATQQLSNSASKVLPVESGGVTVPTAETTADGVDVEDGVEVLSTPQEPFVGMSFNTSDAAKDYYNSYARHTCFSIRIDTSRESKKANEKTKEHNHERLRKFSLTKYLKSHRDIPAEEKEFIKLLHGCCITTTRAYQIMAELYGGIENCPYTEGDAKNLRVEYRAKYRGKDVKATLEYFEELKKEDPEFYYSYTLDEFDGVENLFWVDGAAMITYELYSDCLSFDTTYLTNAYNMPCAPFIVCSLMIFIYCYLLESRKILLGCGFLRNEKTEGFVWLFTEFKKAMGGKDPANIITDQDIAMKAAIAEVFVSSVHRNCCWHIIKGDGKQELVDDFKDCIDNSFTPSEFEQKWQAFLDKYELNNDERFQHLYDKRHCWIPAYFMHCFFLFLQTTARSEGFNAVLKRYVNPKNSILNFVQQYKKIQQRIFSKQDLRLSNVFQHELQLSSSYYVVRVEGDDLIDVVPYRRCPDLLYETRTFRVTSSRVEGLYSCTCCKFERDGVLCCHILKVFDALAVHEVPDRYILPRWSVELVVDSGVEVAANEPLQEAQITDHGKHVIRYSRMCTNFNKIARPFMADDEGYGIVSKQVSAL